jgi:hypothetical protein
MSSATSDGGATVDDEPKDSKSVSLPADAMMVQTKTDQQCHMAYDRDKLSSVTKNKLFMNEHK